MKPNLALAKQAVQHCAQKIRDSWTRAEEAPPEQYLHFQLTRSRRDVAEHQDDFVTRLRHERSKALVNLAEAFGPEEAVKFQECVVEPEEKSLRAHVPEIIRAHSILGNISRLSTAVMLMQSAIGQRTGLGASIYQLFPMVGIPFGEKNGEFLVYNWKYDPETRRHNKGEIREVAPAGSSLAADSRAKGSVVLTASRWVTQDPHDQLQSILDWTIRALNDSCLEFPELPDTAQKITALAGYLRAMAGGGHGGFLRGDPPGEVILAALDRAMVWLEKLEHRKLIARLGQEVAKARAANPGMSVAHATDADPRFARALERLDEQFRALAVSDTDFILAASAAAEQAPDIEVLDEAAFAERWQAMATPAPEHAHRREARNQAAWKAMHPAERAVRAWMQGQGNPFQAKTALDERGVHFLAKEGKFSYLPDDSGTVRIFDDQDRCIATIPYRKDG